MEKNRRKGRPPKNGTVKAARLNLRLSVEEMESYRKAARGLGLHCSEWIRRILNEAVR